MTDEPNPVLRNKRHWPKPSQNDLAAALCTYRQDTGQTQARSRLLLLLDQAVNHFAYTDPNRGTSRHSRSIEKLLHSDETAVAALVERTMRRIERESKGNPDDVLGNETGLADEAEPQVWESLSDETLIRLPNAAVQASKTTPKMGPPKELLANYDAAKSKAAEPIYNYVNEKTINIARNMEAERYVPNGGFYDKALIERLRTGLLDQGDHKASPVAGKLPPLRGGGQRFTSLDAAFDDDDRQERGDTLVARAGMIESGTPINASRIRIKAILPWIYDIPESLVGQRVQITLRPVKDRKTGELKPTKTKMTRFTQDHLEIWRQYLAFPDAAKALESENGGKPELADMSEAQLAEFLGVDKNLVQDCTNEVFAAMLQREDFCERLPQLVPYSAPHSGGSEVEKQTALMTVLHSPQGKAVFRALALMWLEKAYV